jgi:hypothetical protein
MEEQASKLEAMMEAMGAAGTGDLSTLSAHAVNNRGALAKAPRAAVNGLLGDVAQHKLDEGSLTMSESGAALQAMMHGQNSNIGGNFGARSGFQNLIPSAATRASAPLEVQQPKRSALAEARAKWPDLWLKWSQKLEAKGFLKGIPEGSAEWTVSLERAATKFLQSKAVAENGKR